VLERLGVGRGDLRAYVAMAIAVLAAVVTYRGLHQATHVGTAAGIALLLVSRAVMLGRSLRLIHLAASAALVVLAYAVVSAGHDRVGWLAVAAAGAVAMLPERPPSPAGAEDRRHVWALVDATAGDPIAPFALRSDKSYVFSADRRAAIGYRVWMGTAVAAGDPVGDPGSYPDAVDTFVAHTEAQGWRAAVLAASDRSLPLWRKHGLRAVPIGRDVTVDVPSFSMAGRRFRNLRQAVQRAQNAGVTTEILVERDVDDALRDELAAVTSAAGKAASERGFAMILDSPLSGRHPGTFLAIARSRAGEVVAFQRYATANGGTELTLDVPWRRQDAPNGVDERLIADVIAWGNERGAKTVSLAFAAFPELFDLEQRNLLQQLAFRSVHLLDRFIRVESLYRFLRKFHAMGSQRYVVLRPLQVVSVAVTALMFEFGGRRGR
jgi:lysylphosphatidylglycerol synthetase-like protein (DUF2156 family)